MYIRVYIEKAGKRASYTRKLDSANRQAAIEIIVSGAIKSGFAVLRVEDALNCKRESFRQEP